MELCGWFTRRNKAKIERKDDALGILARDDDLVHAEDDWIGRDRRLRLRLPAAKGTIVLAALLFRVIEFVIMCVRETVVLFLC